LCFCFNGVMSRAPIFLTTVHAPKPCSSTHIHTTTRTADEPQYVLYKYQQLRHCHFLCRSVRYGPPQRREAPILTQHINTSR
jgi:hypothetical protein